MSYNETPYERTMMSNTEEFTNSDFVLRILELQDICNLATVAVHASANTPEQRAAAGLAEAAINMQQSIINKLVEQNIEYGDMMDQLVKKVQLLLPPK